MKKILILLISFITVISCYGQIDITKRTVTTDTLVGRGDTLYLRKPIQVKNGNGVSLIGDVSIHKFSDDVTLSGNSDTIVPTEKAIKAYADAIAATIYWTRTLGSIFPITLTDSVGIGTNDPSEKLEVDGNIKAGDSVFINTDTIYKIDITGNTLNFNNQSITGLGGDEVEFPDTLIKIGTRYNEDTLTASLYDSLAVHLDTLQSHNIRINNVKYSVDTLTISLYDSLVVHNDSLIAHNARLIDVEYGLDTLTTSVYDSLVVHLDTLQSHNTRLIEVKYSVDTLTTSLYDSLSVHLDTLQAHNTRLIDVEYGLDTLTESLYDSLVVHLDTLEIHNTRLIAVEYGLDTLTTSIYDSLGVHLDTLQAHNTRLIDIEYGLDTLASNLYDTAYSHIVKINGKQDALTFGIANTNVVLCGADISDDDFLRINGTTLEGRSDTELKSDLSLNNVENTALSTWAGTTNITTLGTVTTGTLSTGAVLGDVTMTLGSDADGDVYYRSSGKLTRLPKGTADQVLTMNAGATAPEWGDASSGASVDSSDMVICRIENDTVYKFYGLNALDNALTYAKVKANNVYRIECYADTLLVTQNVAVDSVTIDAGSSYIYKTNAGAFIDLDADDINLFEYLGNSDINSTYGIIDWNEAGNLNTRFVFEANDITSSDASLIYLNINGTAYTSQLDFSIKFNNYNCSYASEYSIFVYGYGSTSSYIKGNIDYNSGYSSGYGAVSLINQYRGTFDVKVNQRITESLSSIYYAINARIIEAWTTTYAHIDISGEWVGTKTAYILSNGTYSGKGINCINSIFHNKSYLMTGSVFLENSNGYSTLTIGSINGCVTEINGNYIISINTFNNSKLFTNSGFDGICEITNPIHDWVAGTSTTGYAIVNTVSGASGTIILNGIYKRSANGRTFNLNNGIVILNNFWITTKNGGGTNQTDLINSGGYLKLNNCNVTYTATSTSTTFPLLTLAGGTLELNNSYLTSSTDATGLNIVDVSANSTLIHNGGFMKVVNASSYAVNVQDTYTLTVYNGLSIYTNSTINTNSTGVRTEAIVDGGTIVPSITLP